MAHGTEVLHRLAARAVTRLAVRGHSASLHGRLFSDAELIELADAIAATNATADLLGRAMVRDWCAQVQARHTVKESVGTSLAVPVRLQSTNYSCGAAALQAVLDFWGIEGSEKEVGSLAGTNALEGTRPQEIIDVARKLGLAVEERHGATWHDLGHSLTMGCPLLCAVQMHGGGHWVVVTGLELSNAQQENRSWNTSSSASALPASSSASGTNAVPSGTLTDPLKQPTCQKKAWTSLEDQSRLSKDAGETSTNLSATTGGVIHLMDPASGSVTVPASDFAANWHDRDVDGVLYDHYAIAIGRPAVPVAESVFREEISSTPVAPLPPEEAIAYFRKLVPTLGIDPQRFGLDMRRQAFTLAAATDNELLGKVQALISDRLQSGRDFRAAPQEIGQLLTDAGVSPANPQYAEMVFRTNLMDSYNQAADAERRDPDVIGTFPVWKYSNPADGRSRPEHKARNGNYYPADVPFVQVRGTGPEDACNCRCVPIPVDKWDWQKLHASGKRIADGYPDVPGKPEQPATPQPTTPVQPRATPIASPDELKQAMAGDARSHELHQQVASLADPIKQLARQRLLIEDEREKIQDKLNDLARKGTRKAKEAYKLANEELIDAVDRLKAKRGELEQAKKNAAAQAHQALASSKPVTFNQIYSEPVSPAVMGKSQEGAAFLGRLLHADNVPPRAVEFFVGELPTSERAHYSPWARKVRLTPNGDTATAAHELGHHIENTLPGAKEAAQAFLQHRVGNEPLVPLQQVNPNGKYDADEKGRRDDFEKTFQGDTSRAYYAGKHYDGGDTEIISMGLELLYTDPVGFAERDPEYFRFIVGILHGALRT